MATKASKDPVQVIEEGSPAYSCRRQHTRPKTARPSRGISHRPPKCTKTSPIQPCNTPEEIERPEVKLVTECTLITEYRYQLDDECDYSDSVDGRPKTLENDHQTADNTDLIKQSSVKGVTGTPCVAIIGNITSNRCSNVKTNVMTGNCNGERMSGMTSIRCGYHKYRNKEHRQGNAASTNVRERTNFNTRRSPCSKSCSKSTMSVLLEGGMVSNIDDKSKAQPPASRIKRTTELMRHGEKQSRSRPLRISVSSDDSSATSCGEDSPRVQPPISITTDKKMAPSKKNMSLWTSPTTITRTSSNTTRSHSMSFRTSLTSTSSEDSNATSIAKDSPRVQKNSCLNKNFEKTQSPRSVSRPVYLRTQSSEDIRRTSGYADRTSKSNCIPTSVENVASPRALSRPMSARMELRKHHENQKETLVDEMRQDLHRRLRKRKERSIVGDDIFQRQLKSGFWTSEVLYHQWGNSILTMRSKWKDNSSQEFIQPNNETDQETSRLQSRRQAISVDRDTRSPLTMTTMSIIPIGEETDYTVPISNERRRPSEFLAQHRALQNRSYSMEIEGPPIRLGMEEDAYTRRMRLKSLLRETFIKVLRIIRVLYRMIEASKASTYAGLMASIHFSASPLDPDDPTNFNKDHYSRKYAELHVPAWAKQIARKDPWDRAPEEIIRVYGVMRNMRSFEKFTRRMRMEICRAARYTECGKGRVIVRQGHVGHNFYFIFSGSVFVQIDVQDEATGLTTTTNVNVLGRGTCFGELALLGNGTRTASIICRELTELFEIEKEAFHEVCSDIFDNELADKVQVVQEMSFFQPWPEDLLRRLCFESPIQEVDFGKVVESDPGSSEYCYVVLKGKVTILKQCDLVMGLCQHYTTELDQAGKTKGSKEAEIGLQQQSQPQNSRGSSCLSGSKSLAPGEGLAEKLTNLLLPEWTRGGKCHMRIGVMSAGQSTDFLPLKMRDREILAGMTLVSRGCRLLRITKQRIEKLAPPTVLETFKTKHASILPTPSNEELFERFLCDVTWYHYRSHASKTAFGKISVDLEMGVKEGKATALLENKRGRMAIVTRLKELLEKHSKNTQKDGDDGGKDEMRKTADELQETKVNFRGPQHGALPSSFNNIKEALMM